MFSVEITDQPAVGMFYWLEPKFWALRRYMISGILDPSYDYGSMPQFPLKLYLYIHICIRSSIFLSISFIYLLSINIIYIYHMFCLSSYLLSISIIYNTDLSISSQLFSYVALSLIYQSCIYHQSSISIYLPTYFALKLTAVLKKYRQYEPRSSGANGAQGTCLAVIGHSLFLKHFHVHSLFFQAPL